MLPIKDVGKSDPQFGQATASTGTGVLHDVQLRVTWDMQRRSG